MTGSKRHVAEYAITDIASAITILKVLGRHDAKKNIYWVADEELLDLLTKDAQKNIHGSYRCTENSQPWIWVKVNEVVYVFAVIGTKGLNFSDYA